MMIKNKKVLFLSGFLLLAIVTGSTAFAQDDEKGSSDHPLISRFPGSSILTYDLKQFNNYLIPLGKMLNDTLEKSQKLEGKVTQITYAAPKDRSIQEIFRNYETFLKDAGFVILFSSKKDELGTGWLDKFLKATPRAYRYGAPGLDIRMAGDFLYLAAKLTSAKSDVYVALCVATSWFQDFPVIELDVIETIPMDIGMMKMAAKADKPGAQITGDIKSDRTGQDSKDAKSLDLRFGIGGYSFTDPMLVGSSNNFRDNQSGIITGSLTGFRMLSGPYFNVKFFFDKNFGLSLDVNAVMSEEYVSTSAVNYTSRASLFSQKVGLTGQLIGESTPVRLSATLGAGNCITELYQQTNMVPPNIGTDLYLKGKASMFVMFFNIDVSFPIYRKLFLFGNYEFNAIPVGDFVMKQAGGSDYSNTFYSIDFGGSHFRFGLGYSF